MESERDRKIRERAYELWVQGGQRSDSAERDWHQATQEYAAGSESPDVEAAAGTTKKGRGKAVPAGEPDTKATRGAGKGAPARKSASADAGAGETNAGGGEAKQAAAAAKATGRGAAKGEAKAAKTDAKSDGAPAEKPPAKRTARGSTAKATA